jgi:hypothetical protein
MDIGPAYLLISSFLSVINIILTYILLYIYNFSMYGFIYIVIFINILSLPILLKIKSYFEEKQNMKKIQINDENMNYIIAGLIIAAISTIITTYILYTKFGLSKSIIITILFYIISYIIESLISMK